MPICRRFYARLTGLFSRRQRDAALDAELRAHLDLLTEERLREGLSPGSARSAARRAFGGVEQVKEIYRDQRGWPFLESLVQDIRYAVRTLLRSPGFTTAAIGTLALAIGLNATVFTVMDAMLFRGYPLVQHNNRLLYLQERDLTKRRCCVSYPDFEDWRTQARSFDGMAYVGSNRPIALRIGEARPLDLLTFVVSANTFDLLGVRPLLGRTFLPGDEVAGAPPVVLLNYRFWESRLGRRTDVIGSSVEINGHAGTIIGVMPPGFDFPTQEDLWMPVVRTPDLRQRGFTPGGFMVVARLRTGVRREQALAELETINRRLAESFPDTNRDVSATVATHAEITSGRDAPVIWGSLWVAAWFVWLIASANVANLILARTTGRWRECSTRMALGAGAWRVARQLFLEGLVLAIIAGALGWLATRWGLDAWASATESQFQVMDYSTTAGTAIYLIGISLAAAVVISLAPIWQVVRLGIAGTLKADSRAATQSRRGARLSAGLVAGQTALSLVLLAGAGVLLRSFASIVTADTGVRGPERVLIGSVVLPTDKYPPLARQAYFDRISATVEALPGVDSVSFASRLPVHGSAVRMLEIEGRSGSPQDAPAVSFLTVSPGYFRVLGRPALSGRDFTTADRTDTAKVAIVNERFAATFFPGEGALGKRVRAIVRGQPAEWLTVVGVAPNIMQDDALRQRFTPLLYVSGRQYPQRAAYFLVRTTAAPDGLEPAVRSAVQGLDPDVVLQEYSTLEARLGFDRDSMDAEHSELGKHATVAPFFAGIALLLAAVGLYAVMAHAVAQRTRELGLRVAVGATASNVRRLIYGQGMRPVLLGLGVGLVASFAVNRVLQSQLVGVSPYDPVTLAVAPALLILVAVMACHIPSQRALRVDPAVALRHE
ncbi:MAG: ADOP family duplicated permease [Vicinamibacterales bacterium]